MKYEFEYQCDVPWDEMKGGDRKRHCDKCDKKVHHISGMTKEQALEFLDKRNWEVCVDFHCDANGDILFREKERRLNLQLDGAKQLVAMALAVAPLALAAAFLEPEVRTSQEVATEPPIALHESVAQMQPSQPVFGSGFAATDDFEPEFAPMEIEAPEISPVVKAPREPVISEPQPTAEEWPEVRLPIKPSTHLRGRIAPRKIDSPPKLHIVAD